MEGLAQTALDLLDLPAERTAKAKLSTAAVR
jgi:hypothetical protein